MADDPVIRYQPPSSGPASSSTELGCGFSPLFRISILPIHSSALLIGKQITFRYSEPLGRMRFVRAIIVCAFKAHMIGLSTRGPRTTSSAVLS